MEVNTWPALLEKAAPAWAMVLIFIGHITWQSFIFNKKAAVEQGKRIDTIEKTLVTKTDLNTTKTELKADLNTAKAELRADIKRLSKRIDELFKQRTSQ